MNYYQEKKCIRFVKLGDLLVDDQKRLICFCRNCKTHFVELSAFQLHISKCAGLEDIIELPANKLKYNDSMREIKYLKNNHEMHIYEIEGVRKPIYGMPMPLNFDANFDSVRWYSEQKWSMSVTPPLKGLKLPTNKTIKSGGVGNCSKSSKQSKLPVEPGLKRAADNAKMGKGSHSKGLDEEKTSSDSVDTEEILNKLRTFGVVVKRRYNAESDTPPTAPSPMLSDDDENNNSGNDATHDIMRKLELKGVQCTKIAKNDAK